MSILFPLLEMQSASICVMKKNLGMIQKVLEK